MADGRQRKLPIGIENFLPRRVKGATMTGCLRVVKESFFTGLNNLKVLSVTSV